MPEPAYPLPRREKTIAETTRAKHREACEHNTGDYDCSCSLLSENAALKAALANAQKEAIERCARDAQRYQQARQMQIHIYGDFDLGGARIYHSGTSLDAAIDAALAAKGKDHG
jgi:hypothetical protein